MNDRPLIDTDRLTAAVGFLSEVRAAGVNCTLTSRSREELCRLTLSGDDDAFAELIRRDENRELVAA